MKNKTLLKSLLIIFLIGNFGFIQGEQITVIKNTNPNILIGNELNVPLNSTEKDMIMNNVLFKRLMEENENLTYGEVSAFALMINKQMNQSKQFDFKLYMDYINSSSEYPIEGFNLTARELYNVSSPVKDFINKMDGQILKFTKLSREEMTDFLLTETPSVNTTKNIFANADVNEILYYMNDLDILSNVSSDLSDFNLDTAFEMGNKLRKTTDDFNYNISVHNLMYKMDLSDGLVNTSLTTKFDKNSSLEKIKSVKDNLVPVINHLNTLISTFSVLIVFCLAVAVGFVIVTVGTFGITSFVLLGIIAVIVILEAAIAILTCCLIIFRNLSLNVEKLYDEIKMING